MTSDGGMVGGKLITSLFYGALASAGVIVKVCN